MFELHGFAPLETRAVEPVERLLGKGGDADKEIYGIHRLADGAGRDAELGLHFDLTVPFARYVLENAGKLQFPFRRYQVQKVWRGERPQEGRFREFTQADIDVVDVGELAPHFEAEMPLVVAEVFGRLPVGEFRIQVNNRKIPEGFYLGIGLDDVAGTLRIVDKLDKIGPGPVAEMLIEHGASEEQARLALALAGDPLRGPRASSSRCARSGCGTPRSTRGSRRWPRSSPRGWSRPPDASSADLRVARGLDYYTGTVYETQLVGAEEWGSVCSGGRYDSLASDGRTTYPGVGISIGLTRLVHLLVAKRGLTADRSTPAAVLVAVADEESRGRSRAVAAGLRARGIPCEVAPSAARFGKQIRYADRRGIPYVWFPGAPRTATRTRSRTSAVASRSTPTPARGGAPPA